MPLLASNEKLLLPARLGFIVLSLLLALIFNLLPWRSMVGIPDMLALVILFWSIHQPRRIGIGAAWLLGLVMDATNGVLIGQHALAYGALAFAGNGLHRRILWFPLWQQALHALVLLLASQALMVAVRMMAGGTFPGLWFFTGSVIAAALWPLATFILLAPQRAAAEIDETRPI